MATNFTLAQMSTAGNNPVNVDPTDKNGRGVLFFRYVVVDFDRLATSTGTSLAADDTYQIMKLNKNETVLKAGIKVLKVATAAADLDLGMTTLGATAFATAIIIDDNDALPTQTGTQLCSAVHIKADTSDTLDILTTTQSPAGAVIQVWALIARI